MLTLSRRGFRNWRRLTLALLTRSSIFGPIAKFAITPEDAQNMWISPSEIQESIVP